MIGSHGRPPSRGVWIRTQATELYHALAANVIEYRRDHLIGVTTILLTCQALLLSRVAQSEHNAATSMCITFLFELTKLVMTAALYLFFRSRQPVAGAPLLSVIKVSWQDSLQYCVPALIYLINDNLLFAIFAMVEATTFEILGNMRIISTAVLFNVIFKRQLSNVQWAALALLCIGSGTSQLVTCGHHIISSVTSEGFSLVLVYCFLSGFAGVYTEYLFKRRSQSSFLVQNMQLYLYGTLINGIVLYVLYGSAVWEFGLLTLAGRNINTVLVVFTHAVSGIAISAIVKFADNIARVYAHSVSMLLTMVVTSFISKSIPSMQLIFGILIVIISLYLYHLPLPTLTSAETEKKEDKETADLHDDVHGLGRRLLSIDDSVISSPAKRLEDVESPPSML